MVESIEKFFEDESDMVFHAAALKHTFLVVNFPEKL